MAQRSNMWYTYFRFYIDEADIVAGLNQYCTEWEQMFAIGYNYQEYKCFVDNLGGFEHWVGDMQGYISQTREIGFIDAAPSDSVYDSTLLMGKTKITDDDILILNSVPRNQKIMFRKLTGQDAGIAHKIKFVGGTSIITHPTMYTYDSNQIEIFSATDDITDSSDIDSYEFTVDVPITWFTSGIEDSKTGGTVTNFSQMVDRDKTTYGVFQNNAANGTPHSLIIDMEKDFTAVAVDLQGFFGDPWIGDIHLYTSPDKVTWTLIGTQLYGDACREIMGTNNISGKYIKIKLTTRDSAWHAKVYIYRILCS